MPANAVPAEAGVRETASLEDEMTLAIIELVRAARDDSSERLKKAEAEPMAILRAEHAATLAALAAGAEAEDRAAVLDAAMAAQDVRGSLTQGPAKRDEAYEEWERCAKALLARFAALRTQYREALTALAVARDVANEYEQEVQSLRAASAAAEGRAREAVGQPDPPPPGRAPREERDEMKYRKRPVVVEAHKWGGDAMALMRWAEATGNACLHFDLGGVVRIPTLEGEMTAQLGDWIICGVKGEFYPCKPDIFEATYEPA